jgi:hypothetical protein
MKTDNSTEAMMKRNLQQRVSNYKGADLADLMLISTKSPDLS